MHHLSLHATSYIQFILFIALIVFQSLDLPAHRVFGLDYHYYIANNFEFEWIVFTLNFTSVVNIQCEEAHYFNWSPSDDRSRDGCLLGQLIQYERRNSSVCCYVDPDYEKPIASFTCQCSLEDFVW